MLETVLQYGTGRAAAIGQFAAGKTGTTSNYGDAWFVGWDSRYTVAVWVGYPNSLVPMTTAFNGGPVLGGTFPALIWHDFMTSALQIDKARAEHAAGQERAPPANRAARVAEHLRRTAPVLLAGHDRLRPPPGRGQSGKANLPPARDRRRNGRAAAGSAGSEHAAPPSAAPSTRPPPARSRHAAAASSNPSPTAG